MQEMKLQDLKTKSPTELLSFAEEVAVENASAMRKQELMFAILKQLAARDVDITGTGVVEVWDVLCVPIAARITETGKPRAVDHRTRSDVDVLVDRVPGGVMRHIAGVGRQPQRDVDGPLARVEVGARGEARAGRATRPGARWR